MWDSVGYNYGSAGKRSSRSEWNSQEPQLWTTQEATAEQQAPGLLETTLVILKILSHNEK